MNQYISAPYREVKPYKHIFANNLKNVQGQVYRLWRYVYDYEIEEPKLEPVPFKLKSNKGLSLFRYMKASFFCADLKAQQLTFLSPGSWGDPFEQLFFKDEGVVIGNEKYYIRCICLTYDPIESEEASWLRGGRNKSTVRVEYDFDQLCLLLNQYPDYDFYFSVVDYSLPRKDIVKLAKDFKRGGQIPQSLGEYLNMFSLKRKAFTYEHEIRLFMVSKKAFEDEKIPVACPNIQPIISVCLPPKTMRKLVTVEKVAKAKQIILKHSHLYDVD